ncbi:MAG: hypothetical protein IJ365_04500, partial [Clostridia bacterium]|nr:hypothetical protein [Clostridia bacterium]
VVTRVECEGKFYVWTRSIAIDDSRLVIEDEAVSDTVFPWKSRLFFKKNDVHFAQDKHTMQLLTQDFLMTLKSEQAINMELVPVMNDDNKVDYAVVAESADNGKVYKNRIIIEFEQR